MKFCENEIRDAAYLSSNESVYVVQSTVRLRKSNFSNAVLFGGQVFIPLGHYNVLHSQGILPEEFIF